MEGIRNEQPLEEMSGFTPAATTGFSRVGCGSARRASAIKAAGRQGGRGTARGPGRDFAEVLILLDAVHGQIPDLALPPQPEVQVLPPPEGAREGEAAAVAAPAGGSTPMPRTDADRMKERYQRIIEGQGIQIGVTPYRAPDFNRQPAPQTPAPVVRPPGESPAPGGSPTAAAPAGKAAPAAPAPMKAAPTPMARPARPARRSAPPRRARPPIPSSGRCRRATTR